MQLAQIGRARVRAQRRLFVDHLLEVGLRRAIAPELDLAVDDRAERRDDGWSQAVGAQGQLQTSTELMAGERQGRQGGHRLHRVRSQCRRAVQDLVGARVQRCIAVLAHSLELGQAKHCQQLGVTRVPAGGCAQCEDLLGRGRAGARKAVLVGAQHLRRRRVLGPKGEE